MSDTVSWGVRYVTAAGLRMRVGRHGGGDPLLLITGIGANVDMWAPFARLAGARELIAFDPPGAGLSQRPALPLRMGVWPGSSSACSIGWNCSGWMFWAIRSVAGWLRSWPVGLRTVSAGSCCARPARVWAACRRGRWPR
jgi:pimeloyl-ACP methyl ester carboxylesterase